MVNVGVLYAITAGTAAITVFTVLSRIVKSEHTELVDNRLVNLLRFFFVFCLVDAIWGMLSSRLLIVNQILYTVFTYGFHVCAALSAFLWAGYVIHYLKVNERYTILLNVCRGIFLCIQFTVLVSNVWTKSFFYVDADANYHSYMLRNFMFFMQFLYYAALIIYSLQKMFFERNSMSSEKRKNYVSALLFSCVPLAFGFGQMLWPDASMYSLGFMLTAVLIYSINISAERERYLHAIYENENNRLQEVVLGLAGDYQAIYLVDLDTNEYEIFGEYDEYKNKVAVNFVQTNDFFKDMEENVKDAVVSLDQNEVSEMLDKENIIKQLETKKSFSFNYRLRVSGTQKYYLCKIIRVSQNNDKHNKVIIGVFDDDGRVRKEEEQQKALEEAVISAKNASKAKTDFLFNMSHDIRTPMNSIIGFTALAKKHADDKKTLMEDLEKVSISGEHLLALINDILDMSRIEAGKVKINVKPESIIMQHKHLVSIIRELAVAKNITFETELIGVKKEWVFCDSLHLNQVVLNVLSNAVKYTNPGGRIYHSVEQVDLGNDRVALVITVKDNGIGMSQEFLEKIYNEFEREKSATENGVEGTGLGMSIVKRLVDLMGGIIEIESIKGVGTTVCIRLDFDVANGEQIATADKEDYTVPKGCHVLLVDDNNLNREIAVDILSDLNITSEEACDGAQAVQMISESAPGHFNLVLMDVNMPNVNGYEATRRIRNLENKELADIPIIAMTANAFDEDKHNAFEAGMNSHLSKPIDIVELKRTLSKYLNNN